MMDTLTGSERSERMRRVRQKNTAPELAVRRLLHGMGFRYRIHRKDLPGSPDIVFPSRRKIIFVHGCFWHGHHDEGCNLATVPKTRRRFWTKKISDNRQRDQRNQRELNNLGWDILVIWQCEIRDADRLKKRLRDFLG